MRGADILIDMLIDYGVDTVFGVPGNTNVPLYEALQDREDRITHIMARDERSAGFMADAFGRFTDRIAVVECPSGAGAMYTLPPIAESDASSIPVILLTIDIPLPGEGRGVLTELDCARLFEPITKMSVQIKSANKIPEILRRAFRVATSDKPGAVHLQIPEDLLLQDIEPETVSLHVEDECKAFPSFPTRPAPGLVEELLGHLGTAKKPLIVAGGGAIHACAGDLVRELGERLNIPVCTSMTGQPAMIDDHPLAIGVIGDNGFHPHANRAMEESDFVLFVGSKMGSVVTIGWKFPKITLNKRVAQIDIDPEIMGNNYENVLSVAGDARLVLTEMYAQGSRIFKIKTGFVADHREDVLRVSRIRSHLPDDVDLRIDYNQGLEAFGALQKLKEMEQFRPTFIEQPVKAHLWDVMADLTKRLDTPILADESVFDDRSAFGAAKARIADAFSVKVMKSGGLSKGRAIASIAEQAGIPCYGGTLFEGAIALNAASHLIVATENISLGCEFYMPKYVMDPHELEAEMIIKDGFVHPPDGPGLGLIIDEDVLDRTSIKKQVL